MTYKKDLEKGKELFESLVSDIVEEHEAVDKQVTLPTNDETIKAISVLNKWIYDWGNNGMGSVNWEKERLEDFRERDDMEGFYFSLTFSRYMNRAARILQPYHNIVPALANIAKDFPRFSESDMSKAWNGEHNKISNYNELVMNLDFIDNDTSINYDVLNKYYM